MAPKKKGVKAKKKRAAKKGSAASSKKQVPAQTVLIGVGGALILVGILLYAVSGTTTTESYVVHTNKTEMSSVANQAPVQISYAQFVENPRRYEGESATLFGFLRQFVKGDGSGGVVTQAMVDDGGNAIEFSAIDRDLLELFPERGTTTELYQITGRFDRNFETVLFEVTDIRETERPLAAVRFENVSYVAYTNETRTRAVLKYPGLAALFGRG